MHQQDRGINGIQNANYSVELAFAALCIILNYVYDNPVDQNCTSSPTLVSVYDGQIQQAITNCPDDLATHLPLIV